MLTLSPVVWNSSWPTNVPADAPPPGSADFVIPIVTVDGAAPLVADTLIQFAPLAVLFVRVQFRVPAPAFRIWIVCEVATPLVLKEKLSFPGRSSKNVAPDAATVSVTGIVILILEFEKFVINTCPE
jgi:hypothetical protein